MQGIASLSSPNYAGQGALQDGAVGTLYTDSYANDVLFITANKESHEAKTYRQFISQRLFRLTFFKKPKSRKEKNIARFLTIQQSLFGS